MRAESEVRGEPGGAQDERAADKLLSALNRARLPEGQQSPRSRRPKQPRKAKWPSDLVIAIERLRPDFPMGGKDKLALLLAKEGFKTSASTVGRILKHLVERGVVDPAPFIRKQKT